MNTHRVKQILSIMLLIFLIVLPQAINKVIQKIILYIEMDLKYYINHQKITY